MCSLVLTFPPPQEVQESLFGGGADAAAVVCLAAAAFLLPVGREAGLPVRGGAEGGETCPRQQDSQRWTPGEGDVQEQD